MPVTIMDALVGVDVAVLIKVDVEGYELAMLKGATCILSDPRLLAVIVETNGSGSRYGSNDAERGCNVRANGFYAYNYDPFARCLVNADGAERSTILVRDVEAVSQRVAMARMFELINGEIELVHQ